MREKNLIMKLNELTPVRMICYEITKKNLYKIAQQLYINDDRLSITNEEYKHIPQIATTTKEFVHIESLSGWGILGFFSFGETKHTNDFYLMEIDNNIDHKNVTIKNVFFSTPEIENIERNNTSWEKIDERNLKINSLIEFKANQFGYGTCKFKATVEYT